MKYGAQLWEYQRHENVADIKRGEEAEREEVVLHPQFSVTSVITAAQLTDAPENGITSNYKF
jgi:hypothetical protein